MTRKLAMLGALALTSCAWNPVMTPYAFRDAAKAPAGATATVWGAADGTQMYFREIDGKGLPSRGGGGYPISLSLLPGSYDVEVLFWNYDNRSAEVHVRMTVAAGHTYVVEHRLSPDNHYVGLGLKDLGTETTCHFDRYDKVRGSATLVCE